MSVPKEVMYAFNPTTAFSALAAEKAMPGQGLGEAIDPFGSAAREQFAPQVASSPFSGLVGQRTTTPGVPERAETPFFSSFPSMAPQATDPMIREQHRLGQGPFSRLHQAFTQ